MASDFRGRQQWARGVVAVACLVLVAGALAFGACGSSDSAQGASPEELAAWAQALDAAGSDVSQAASAYEKVAAAVETAVDKNAAALETWDKQWKKRKAAYEKKLNEVEKHNASERARAAANPTRTIPGETVKIPQLDLLTGNVTGYSTIGMGPKTIAGYQPQYLAMPAEPKVPARVKVRLRRQVKALRMLEKQLGELDAQLAALVVGDEFAEPLGDLRAAVTDLQAQTAAARRALRKAVKKDKKRGDVVVAKRLASLDAAAIIATIAALRASLAEAADEAGVSDALTWARSDAAGVASPPSSGSPTP